MFITWAYENILDEIKSVSYWKNNYQNNGISIITQKNLDRVETEDDFRPP